MTTGADYKLFIGGEWVTPADGHYDVINPATEEVVGRAPEASVEQGYEAARAAGEAFESWSRSTPEERAAILDRAADLFEKRGDELAVLAQAETGATLNTAKQMQIGVSLARFRRYAKGAFESNEIPMSPMVTATTALAKGAMLGTVAIRQPVGVVTCITSYNNPLANTMGKVAPALAMGNTIVVKPAPQDPLAVYALADVFREAGLPPGVLNIVTGSGAGIGQAVCEAKEVDMISFTGSTGVGIKIGETAARGMKRTLMELGGKGACVVFDDASIEAAVSGIASTFGFYSGQICTAPTRVIAHRSVVDELVTKLAGAAGFMKVGDPLAADTIVGPVISQAHRDRIESMVADGKAHGATVVAGGERPGMDKGFYVAPTLLADCSADNPAVREELFGPVVSVLVFDDEDEAVRLANDSDFGLISYVFSADTPRANRVARQIRSGQVVINTVARHMEAPFGGFKFSGIGRDCGSFAMHAYSEMQAIVWPS